ncbi:MAG: Uma2 family endonuclease [Polyangiaceae bacterium]|nr:Uma2 family endonuclease [Polyangiaceae bacterium]
MATLDLSTSAPFAHNGHLYVEKPTPIDFPSEEPWEEKVPETKRHLEARTCLYLVLKHLLSDKGVGCDQFLYWDPQDPRKCLSPDAFVKLGSLEFNFASWKVWEKGAPELAVEMVSSSDRAPTDWKDKVARYAASGVAELVRFDTDDEVQPIRVWDRIGGGLVERDKRDPNLRRCKTLELWWVVKSSQYGTELRLANDRDGVDVLPTPFEAAASRAEAADIRAESADRRLQEALAEIERLRAERT